MAKATLENSKGVLAEAVENEVYEDEILEKMQDLLEPFAHKYVKMKAAYDFMTEQGIDETSVVEEINKLECATIKQLFAVVDEFRGRIFKTK